MIGLRGGRTCSKQAATGVIGYVVEHGAGFAEAPRFCPICGSAYDPAEVRTLSADGAIGYTADCPSGHRYSGHLGG